MAQVVFIKLIALSFLFAYCSLYQQVLGLFGSEGISSIALKLNRIRDGDWKTYLYKLPTIFWFNTSDKMVRFVAGSGIVLSLLLLLGFPAAPIFPLLLIGYISFITIGDPFLSFQWDNLLIEVGFLGFLSSIQNPWPPLLKFMVWFILFRLIFSSGIVKLLSNCPEWKCLKALKYHYETQPLPNSLAYYMHQLPEKFERFSVLLLFFLELIVPFFIFLPDPGRLIAFGFLILLQLLIALTGNYAFFNLLTIALCVPLLSDSFYTWIPDWMLYSPMLADHLVTNILLSIISALMLFLNALQLASSRYRIGDWNKFLVWIRPYYIVNGYGLFERMTTIREEIIIEGSEDREIWKVYEFKWKPGDLSVRPKQIAPFQPRLDWHMWFASLSYYGLQPWFHFFLFRLLTGSKPVLHLIKTNPFPEKPPKYIRAVKYRYHFTTLQEKKETGHWWKRFDRRDYSPILSLDQQK